MTGHSLDGVTLILAIPGVSAVLLGLLPGYRISARINMLAAFLTFLSALSLFVDKPAPGARLRNCGGPWRVYAERVAQLSGDSATFDWSPHVGRAGLVFVDGSHAYDYVRKDSETAMRLVRPGGVVLWHDYGVWPGVNQALEEIDARLGLGLVHIAGTSLVFWRAAEGADS